MLRTKKIVATATVATGLLGAGVAFAAWTADGTGSGYAKAGSASGVTTSPVSVDGDLFPGATKDVKVTVNNPNSFPVKVTNIADNGAITTSDADCAGSNITFTGAAVDQAIAANSSATITLTGAAHMVADASNDCQDVTFTIPVSISAASNAA